jgi:hypothetical protein
MPVVALYIFTTLALLLKVVGLDQGPERITLGERIRFARFFLVQHTKTKKIYQMVTKYYKEP